MTCSILISELGLMTEVLNTCMEILTFLVKKRKKDIKLISWHLELFYMYKFKKVNEISQKLIRKGSSMDDLYPVNVSPPSICWVIQPHENPMIQSQYYLTPPSQDFYLITLNETTVTLCCVKLPHRKPSQQHLNVSHHRKNHLNIRKVSTQHWLLISLI